MIKCLNNYLVIPWKIKNLIKQWKSFKAHQFAFHHDPSHSLGFQWRVGQSQSNCQAYTHRSLCGKCSVKEKLKKRPLLKRSLFGFHCFFEYKVQLNCWKKWKILKKNQTA